MSSLNVPHLLQDKPSWCLPACVAMVAAYWEQPLYQADVAQWLGTTDIGTPSGRIQRLARYGFEIIYQTGSLAQLESWLTQQMPCILFVRTGALSYWQLDTAHALVLTGLTSDLATLLDPMMETTPIAVGTDELLLAWSYFDYTYAVLKPENL
ncbi:MAG TPA: papain-like cysteine protease family protein [Chloroflexota bacterium]|nr:papain-like cysteine protease family protein [Chloroflexota bacterium]